MSDVLVRVGYYERIVSDGQQRIRPLPFYTVVIPGFSKVFEPVDCLKRVQMATEASTTGASQTYEKTVNEVREIHALSKLVTSEEPAGNATTLHSFSWDWPT